MLIFFLIFSISEDVSKFEEKFMWNREAFYDNPAFVELNKSSLSLDAFYWNLEGNVKAGGVVGISKFFNKNIGTMRLNMLDVIKGDTSIINLKMGICYKLSKQLYGGIGINSVSWNRCLTTYNRNSYIFIFPEFGLFYKHPKNIFEVSIVNRPRMIPLSINGSNNTDIIQKKDTLNILSRGIVSLKIFPFKGFSVISSIIKYTSIIKHTYNKEKEEIEKVRGELGVSYSPSIKQTTNILYNLNPALKAGIRIGGIKDKEGYAGVSFEGGNTRIGRIQIHSINVSGCILFRDSVNIEMQAGLILNKL